MTTNYGNPKDWKKGNVIVVDNEALILTSKPKKAIDGSYIVFAKNKLGKVVKHYMKQEGK